MSKCIIYPIDDTSRIAIIYPCDCGISVEKIAEKDVPTGIKYRIIDANEVPADRTTRAAWTADFTTYDGIGGVTV